MSFPKKGKSFPKSGDPNNSKGDGESLDGTINFALEIASALSDRNTRIKTVGGWTGANERTVKNWLSGQNGPCGAHLVILFEPIIRFSMQFYNQDLVPLRIPKPSERLDPPLVDIYIEDGQRRGKSKVNPREAEVIVEEIAGIVDAAAAAEGAVRSIGVISLIGQCRCRRRRWSS